LPLTNTGEVMLEVKFNFNVMDHAKTPFGDVGVVVVCAVDDGGKKYFVQRSTNSDWFKESQLEAVTE
jgi:hypothetical protein